MIDYRRLIDLSPAGICAVRQGTVALANPAAAQLLGLPSSDGLVGRPLADLFPAIARAVDAGAAQSAERVQGADGTWRDVEAFVTRIHDDSAIDLLLTLHDTTQRNAAEAALRQSEERLALAVAGAREGVWDWCLDTDAAVYSQRWKEMLGYADDEIEPHVSAWERLVHPDDRRRADEANESVARGAQTYEAEFRLRHKNGHYVHVLSRGYPIRRHPDGPVVRIVGTHLDLTERKAAEAALRENEERLRLAFAGAQEGVWDWNIETGTVVYSTRWKDMLGYSDDEIEPHVRAWERLLHPDDLPRAAEAREIVARGGQIYEGEFRLRHKNGHYVHVLSRGFPVRREADGAVLRIVGTHFDLSERKRVEEILRRGQEELEARVRERTMELARANESLRAEMTERERAEKARTELLARLVFAQEDERRRIAREMHDQFGEQLTALARGIEVLKERTAATPEIAAQVDAVEAVAQQLDRDVDHLVWELRPTALDDLGLRAALANYAANWSKREHIAIELHTSGLLDSRLTADVETTLYRIAQEALTNVAKHARASKVDVILERRPDHVLLIIEDDGVGFDPAERGEGFGLLGMQERAALVGASIEIEAEAGKGTTILLRMATPVEVSATTAADHV